MINKDTLTKMIQKLIRCKGMKKQELARLLNITPQMIDCVCFRTGYDAAAQQIYLPLIKVYCKTK